MILKGSNSLLVNISASEIKNSNLKAQEYKDEIIIYRLIEDSRSLSRIHISILCSVWTEKILCQR